MLADLTAAIDSEFPPDQVADVWAREDRDHEAYAKSRRTDFYVGRDAYFKSLDDFARDGDGGCGMTVLGESGGGKSALLANWVARWREAHPCDFVFQHYIGSSAMSAGHLDLIRRLMVAIVRWCNADDFFGARGLEEEERKIPAAPEEIVKALPDYLDRLTAWVKRKGVGAVLVFDALNQLEDRERGRLLGWLPYRLPGKLRLIVSALPGDTLDALRPRGWPSFTMEPLLPEERVGLISGYLKHFSHGLSDVRARKIAAAPAASNPLFLKTLLDDLRATGSYDRLDSQIEDYLRSADIPALFGRILARYEHDYDRERTDLVREALSLIWVARRGLTEPELLEALRPAGQDRLPAAIWSPVRYALEEGLIDRDGVLAFAHEHLRTAVERCYLNDSGVANTLRLRLADSFAARPVDVRQADELPWLLTQAGSCDGLRDCLLDIDRFLLIRARAPQELLEYWVWLKEERTMGRAYLESFELWSRNSEVGSDLIAHAANELGSFLAMASQNSEAESLLRRALAVDEQAFGHDHRNVAGDLNNLAALLQNTNRLSEAEALFRRALAITKKSRQDRDVPSIMKCLNNLALLLHDRGRLHEAEALFRWSLACDESVNRPDQPDVGIGLNNLARTLIENNRLAEAEPLMRRSVTILETSLGKNHPKVAAVLNNLGGLLLDTNRLMEAEPLMRRVVKIFEHSYGAEHPDVATALGNLGALLQDTNRLEEAETVYRRALAIDEVSLGQFHCNVARDLSNLGGVLYVTNRLRDAEPMLRRALAIGEQSCDPDHPRVATRLNNLAQLLRATNRLKEAEPLMLRALAIYEVSYGPEHPRVATSLNNLADLLRATNRLEEAEPLMLRALAIDEASYGPEHPKVAMCLHNLGQLLMAANRLEEADPLLRRAIEALLISMSATGQQHPLLKAFVVNYTALLRAMGRNEVDIEGTLADLSQSYGIDFYGMNAERTKAVERDVQQARTESPAIRKKWWKFW